MPHPVYPPGGRGITPLSASGLHDHQYEHDACGVGFVARLHAPASHEVVERALEVLGPDGASRRRGRRPRDGRRRRHPDPASRRVPARRGRLRAARGRPLRRRDVLPAARRGRPRPRPPHARARGRGSGPVGARLARGAGRLQRLRPHRRAPARRTPHSCSSAHPRASSTRTRWSASSTSPAARRSASSCPASRSRAARRGRSPTRGC